MYSNEELDRHRAKALAYAGVIYHHVSRKIDVLTDTGWRRAFGWIGALVAFYTYIWAPGHHIPVDIGGVNTFLSLVTGAFVTRTIERVNLARAQMPAIDLGGIINPHGGPAAP